MSQRWLPVWQWTCPTFPDGAVILMQASEEFAGAVRSETPSGFFQSLTETLQRLPDFAGMVYVMRNKQDLSVLKVGRAVKDAKGRMRKSPWRKELGRTSHADRSEELTLVCVNVPASVVEKRLHAELGRPAFDKDWGREWFRIEPKHLFNSIRTLSKDEGDGMWFDDGLDSRKEFKNVKSFLLSCPSSAAHSFATIGEITGILQRSEGLDVVTSIWCPVQYYIADNGVPMPFYALPDASLDSSHVGLAAELRAFDVDAFAIEPDVIWEGSRLVSGSPCQHMHRISRVGSTVPGHDPLLDVTKSEWEVDGDIYEIDFRTQVNVLEKFRQDAEGHFRREGCEQLLQ